MPGIQTLIAGGLPNQPMPATSKKQKVKEFLTSGTWTRPAGVETVEVLLVGGGGGGGGISYTGSASSLSSGSGGGGGVVKKLIDVTSIPVGQSVAVTIGAGGTGGTTAGTAGGVGGNSLFGSLLTALGGGGGDGYPTASAITTGIATQGGGSGGSTVNPTYPLFNLGGGSDGPATPAQQSSGVSQSFRSVSSSAIVASLLITTSSSAQLFPTSARGFLGFGAGGSSNGAPCFCGAGNVWNLNAQANTGSGGAGRETYNAASYTAAGGNGGSGYALISWWE